MRVAILTHNVQFGDAIGNQVAEKLAFFLDSGADVRVFAESGRRLHPDVAAHCRRLDDVPEGEGWHFLTGADLVIVEYGQSYRLLNLLPLLARSKPRIIFDYHGVTPPTAWGKQPGAFLTRSLTDRGVAWCADALLTHSLSASDDLQREIGYPVERTFSLGYPIDTSFWSPGAPETDLRSELGIGWAPLLLFVGRLAPNKRVPLLVEAVGRLRSRDVHLVVIGDTGDLYEEEAARCQRRAEELGVSGQVHLLGQVANYRLRDAYRSADLFVMPSVHEGFCLPVLEAMACGVPVLAARATALPETVGDAGLTFAADNVNDLSTQIERLLDPEPLLTSSPVSSAEMNDRQQATTDAAVPQPIKDVGRAMAAARATLPVPPRRRVAVVSKRFGTHFPGGCETSLRTIAASLQAAGHHVEVFTHDHGQPDSDIPVHGFDESAPDKLVGALRVRQAEFDTILAGPYLDPLTLDVATEFADRTVVLPCFHDEPEAWQPRYREVYSRVSALLYHSPEEQQFAEARLGINHPAAACIGTWLDTSLAGAAEAGRKHTGVTGRYVVYCGRYLVEKNVPALLNAARAYAQRHPDRFSFVFMGAGNVPIPHESWARDLGFVAENVKRDVLAGAAALINLSTNESLSLTTLEAWTQGTPVLASQQCTVLTRQLRRSQGGHAVADAGELARALDELWQNPEEGRELGRRGQEYVQSTYGDRQHFVSSLEGALAERERPLIERLRRRGLERAARYSRSAWRDGFAELVEQVLDLPARLASTRLDIEPRAECRSVPPGQESVLVPARLVNRGTQPVLAEGPARVVLRSEVLDDENRVLGALEAQLPALLAPGQTQALALPVPVPARRGDYRAVFHVLFAEDRERAIDAAPATLELRVGLDEAASGPAAPLLNAVQKLLAEAQALQRLPDDYVDVSEGRFARCKRWLKAKLLGNFKRGYVDLISRQQSQLNQRLITALAELAECCAVLDHAGKMKQEQREGEENWPGDAAARLTRVVGQKESA